jgi:VanZ family protein
MGLIFLASMDAGSSEHSGRIVERLLVWLGLGRRVTGEQFAAINHYVRKLGHLTEYGILAVVLHRAIAHGRARWTIRVVIVVLGVVLLYAASDEFHQSFVATRTPSVWDVLLDTTGAALVLALKAAGEQRWRRR